MTSRDFLRALRTHWYVVLLGVLVTVAAVRLTVPERVYWVAESVTVAQPVKVTVDTTLQDKPPTTVPAATVLMQLVNGGRVAPASNAADATLYGEGKRDAVSARLRDVGGQWGVAIPDPIIDIQVVGPTADGVARRLDGQVAMLRAQLTALQDRLDVAPSQRLVIETSDFPAPVAEVTGSRMRSTASTTVLGAVLTGAVIVGAAGRRRRRQRSRPSGERSWTSGVPA